jgi:hypothetical protein
MSCLCTFFSAVTNNKCKHFVFQFCESARDDEVVAKLSWPFIQVSREGRVATGKGEWLQRMSVAGRW